MSEKTITLKTYTRHDGITVVLLSLLSELDRATFLSFVKHNEVKSETQDEKLMILPEHQQLVFDNFKRIEFV